MRIPSIPDQMAQRKMPGAAATPLAARAASLRRLISQGLNAPVSARLASAKAKMPYDVLSPSSARQAFRGTMLATAANQQRTHQTQPTPACILALPHPCQAEQLLAPLAWTGKQRKVSMLAESVFAVPTQPKPSLHPQLGRLDIKSCVRCLMLWRPFECHVK